MISCTFNTRWRKDFLNFQIKFEILWPNGCLKVEQSCSMNRYCHVRNHRDEIIRVWSWLSKAIVIIMIAKHWNPFTATIIYKSNKIIKNYLKFIKLFKINPWIYKEHLTVSDLDLSCSRTGNLLEHIDDFRVDLYKFHRFYKYLANLYIHRYLKITKTNKKLHYLIQTFAVERSSYLHRILNRRQCDIPRDKHIDNFREYSRKCQHTSGSSCELHIHQYHRMFGYSHSIWSQLRNRTFKR